MLSVSGSLATTLGYDQPFMYRGYVYDKEIGLYYLHSRYYDPATCRFISADVLLSTGQGVLGNNSFAYCLNDPVNSSDPCGYLTFKGIIGFFRELVEGGSGGVHIPTGRGSLPKGLSTTSSSSNGTIGASSGAATGASALAGTVGTTAGGAAPLPQGRPEEDTQLTKLMQNNSLDGGGYAKGFRGKLQRLTGIIGEGMEAHHVFPQAFETEFEALQITINDPRNGAWVESNSHRWFSYEYNQDWKYFLIGKPSTDDAFRFAQELAGKYGYSWSDWR